MGTSGSRERTERTNYKQDLAPHVPTCSSATINLEVAEHRASTLREASWGPAPSRPAAGLSVQRRRRPLEPSSGPARPRRGVPPFRPARHVPAGPGSVGFDRSLNLEPVAHRSTYRGRPARGDGQPGPSGVSPGDSFRVGSSAGAGPPPCLPSRVTSEPQTSPPSLGPNSPAQAASTSDAHGWHRYAGTTISNRPEPARNTSLSMMAGSCPSPRSAHRSQRHPWTSSGTADSRHHPNSAKVRRTWTSGLPSWMTPTSFRKSAAKA